jgi:hypothetical protein
MIWPIKLRFDIYFLTILAWKLFWLLVLKVGPLLPILRSGATTFSITTFDIKTFGIKTLSIKTLIIKTLSIKGLFGTLSIMTLSINDT